MDTIHTAPADIAIQLIHWLCRQPEEGVALQTFQQAMGSDDLRDAYHGVPNHPGQLCFCAVAFRDVQKDELRFAASYGHIFGFKAAVNNFNRLLELLTAVALRIGGAATSH